MVAMSAVVFMSALFGAFALTQKHRHSSLSTSKGWVLDGGEDDDQETEAQDAALQQAKMQGKEAAWQAQLDAATKEGYQEGMKQAEDAKKSMAEKDDEAQTAKEESDFAKKEEEERIEMEQIAEIERKKAEDAQQAQQKAEEERQAAERRNEKVGDAEAIRLATEQAVRAAQQEREIQQAEQELAQVNKELEMESGRPQGIPVPAMTPGMGPEDQIKIKAAHQYNKEVEDCFKYGCLKKPDQKSIFDKMLDGLKGITGNKASGQSEEALR